MDVRKNLSVMKDASEIIHYRNASIPIFVSQGRISAFVNHEMICHWHDDIEFIEVLSGRMIYDVNGVKFKMRQGDAIMINSRQLHYGYLRDSDECTYRCILFQPRLLMGNEGMTKTFIEPITENENLSVMILDRTRETDRRILAYYSEIYHLYMQNALDFELKALSRIAFIWQEWFTRLKDELDHADSHHHQDISLQKEMVDFIYKNYQEKITLKDIAAAGGVCRSRCCQIFKKYLGKSPVEFLSVYRMEISMSLLQSTDCSVTDIAYACGFSSSSYFTETFTRYKGCPPRVFRQRRKEPDMMELQHEIPM